MDLCLSPAGAKKNLSSDTYIKDDTDIANMEDLEAKIPVIVETLVNEEKDLEAKIPFIVETLVNEENKEVSSIASSNLAVSAIKIKGLALISLLQLDKDSRFSKMYRTSFYLSIKVGMYSEVTALFI